MTRRKYGLQLGMDEKTVWVGRINKAQTIFLDKEDHTQEFLRAVVERFLGDDEAAITEITAEPSGDTITITARRTRKEPMT